MKRAQAGVASRLFVSDLCGISNKYLFKSDVFNRYKAIDGFKSYNMQTIYFDDAQCNEIGPNNVISCVRS
jgi:hypothetical protein